MYTLSPTQAKKTGSSKLRSKFETLRREVKADVKKQHNLYVSNLVGDIKAYPRDFYRYINGQKKDTQGIPPFKRRNGNGVAESELEQADEFNSQFTDVFNKNEHSQVPFPNRLAPFMNDIVVSAVGVTKLLKGLNPSKALQRLTYDFGKHLPGGQACHNFNLPYCLTTCPVINTIYTCM